MASKSGTYGWVALAGLVVSYDMWAMLTEHETMTSAFGRALEHPLARWPVLAAWGITTLHLLGRMPRQIDPFHVLSLTTVQVRKLSGHKGQTVSALVVERSPSA